MHISDGSQSKYKGFTGWIWMCPTDITRLRVLRGVNDNTLTDQLTRRMLLG